MDIFDKFLKQYSYKFDKGYPDMNNPKDKKMLLEFAYKLTEKITVLNEQQVEYDKRIKNALKLTDEEEIPVCNAKLKIGDNFTLTGKDQKIWEELYSVKPLRADQKAPSSGAGFGEISTYWAYQYNANESFEVIDSRKGEDPDLSINNIGVELKAYESKGAMTLGKFSRDEESNTLLNRVFGVMSLFKEASPDVKIKPAGPGKFSSTDMLEAFIITHSLLGNDDLRKVSLMDVFYKKIDDLYDQLNIEDEISPQKATANLLRKVLTTKLRKKPMLGNDIGYILNVTSNGKGFYQEISEKTITAISDDSLLNGGVSVASSEIKMNFNKLFGK